MVKLFCAIVGVAGDAFPVNIDAGQSVGDLKKKIKKDNQNKLKDVDANDLQVFAAKKGGAWLSSRSEDVKKLKNGEKIALIEALTTEELQEEDPLEDMLSGMGPPSFRQTHLLVVVPNVNLKRSAAAQAIASISKKIKPEPKTLTKLLPLSVTEVLEGIWRVIRQEEVVFGVLVVRLLTEGKNRVVIVGSPGVGKSCFLMLMAFYLACIKKKKVLVIRRVKEVNTGIAVVFFDGQGSYSPQTNLSPDDLFAIRNQVGPATVLVDGFRQDEADSFTSGLLPFACLATSCQFDAKQDDNSQVVVLPAWREADLLEYAKSSEWVIETGLRKTTQLKFSTWPKLVQEQYFYSGGSLREFCRTREDVKTRVVDACATVKDIQAFQLVYSYGGAKTEDQVDRIRRHYIADCSMEEHYRKRSCWVLSVDSGYALTKLGVNIDTDKLLRVYDFAKCIGGSFHGVAYELLLHNAVRGAFTKGKPIVLKMREGSKYERIEIRVRHVVCIGENEAACYPCLSALDKDTYWYPSYPFFPFIDAVTTCQAFPSGSEEFDTIVAYLQVTVAGEKKFRKEDCAG